MDILLTPEAPQNSSEVYEGISEAFGAAQHVTFLPPALGMAAAAVFFVGLGILVRHWLHEEVELEHEGAAEAPEPPPAPRPERRVLARGPTRLARAMAARRAAAAEVGAEAPSGVAETPPAAPATEPPAAMAMAPERDTLASADPTSLVTARPTPAPPAPPASLLPPASALVAPTSGATSLLGAHVHFVLEIGHAHGHLKPHAIALDGDVLRVGPPGDGAAAPLVTVALTGVPDATREELFRWLAAEEMRELASRPRGAVCAFCGQTRKVPGAPEHALPPAHASVAPRARTTTLPPRSGLSH